MTSSDNQNCCAPGRNSGKNLNASGLNQVKSGQPCYEGMVLIKNQAFLMGTDDKEGFKEDGEGPVREVKVDSFYIDQTAVTNLQFAEFMDDTNYKTEAERYGWSFVFYDFIPEKLRHADLPSPKDTPWWKAIEGAYWRHPEGPESTIEDRMDHPVVHISWNDAIAFCNWAGKRLPTEAEWELAARGGLKQKKFPWGNTLTPNDHHQCNIWQGNFPDQNTEEDGFRGTAPAKAFEPNGYGLYNVSGNVWEWCHDWFSAFYPMMNFKENPRGPKSGDAKVIRGGSYLCHKSYCNRYRVAARTANTPDSSTGNLGFRCAAD